MVEVLIIDDLKSARDLIRDILTSDPHIHVCGMADNGTEAVEMTQRLRPHLIVLDSHLKQASGFEVAAEIMRMRPTPIIMVTAESDPLANPSAQAFTCGVLDVIQKKDLYRWRTQPNVAAGLVRKIKLLSKVDRFSMKKQCETSDKKPKPTDPIKGTENRRNEPVKGENRIIAIASSTGGPNALFTVLRDLPADFPAPILIVQHMSPGFIQGLAEWLDHEEHIRVRVAQNNAALLSGQALLAPDDAHLTVDENHRIRLVDSPPVGGHRPSGTILFESVGRIYGPHALGIILTGMGNDGATGMAALKSMGGKTIAQDRDTSVIFGMPKSAIDQGTADKVLPLPEIASAMTQFAKSGR